MGMDMLVGGTDVPKRRHFGACEPPLSTLSSGVSCSKVVIFGRSFLHEEKMETH